MQVEDDAADAGVAQPAQDARRPAASPATGSAALARTRRQRLQPGGQAGGQHQRRPPPGRSFAGAAHLRAGATVQAGEHHVVSVEAVRVAMLQEQEAVRVDDEVRRRAAERARRRRGSRLRRLRSRRTCRPASRRSRSRRRRRRIPRGTSRSGTRRAGRAPRGSCSSTAPSATTSRAPRGSSSRPGMHRALEGQQALAALASARAASIAGAAAARRRCRAGSLPAGGGRAGAWRRARGSRACLVGTVEAKLDLALERPWPSGPPCLFLADGDERLLAAAQHQQERGAARRHLAERAAGFLRRAHRLAVDAQ